jgi:glucose-1-phosphate thymidylyltransferase
MAKQLLPVAGKPILHYVLEQLATAGLTDVGIIVSPQTGGGIRDALGDGSRWGLKLTYIPQERPGGLAHAVQTGQPFLGNSPFLVFLGDNIFQDRLKTLAEEYAEKPQEALIVVKKVHNPQAFGVVEVDAAGRPTRLVEKPKEPKSDLAIVGIYFFPPLVHGIINTLKPSARGELELTDTIQGLLDRGHPVRLHVLKGWWLDTGRKDDMLEANRTLLKTNARRNIQGSVDAASQLTGEVEVGPNATIQRSVIEGPVVIGEGCHISGARIGPFVSIGAGTRIEGYTLSDSIVMEHCIFTGRGEMAQSLVGRHCHIVGMGSGVVLRALLGDHTQLEA